MLCWFSSSSLYVVWCDDFVPCLISLPMNNKLLLLITMQSIHENLVKFVRCGVQSWQVLDHLFIMYQFGPYVRII